MAPPVPANFQALIYPPKNILFFWAHSAGATSYNLYTKPFGSMIWTIVNPIPIQPVKIQYPPMPVDVLPVGVVSVDPFYYGWASLDQINSTDWAVTAVNGGESTRSPSVTFFPKPTQDVQSDRQPNSISQMQRWNPDTQRWINWDASIGLEVGEVNIGNVNVKLKLVAGGEEFLYGGLNPDLLSYFAYIQDQRMNFSGPRLMTDTVIVPGGADSIDEHDSVSAVPINTPTAVLTYTVPVGKILYLQAARGSGYVPAEYWVEIDGTERERQRSNWANWNVKFDFPQDGIKVVAGDLVKVFAMHRFISTQDFNASIYGRLV